tara:strand:- start:343 stop:741 length:399 start_codon:yes stop_codon:yes gene_type:complete
MPLPNEIKVLGLTYKIKFVPLEDVGNDKLGWCDCTTLQLYIGEDQPKSALANTFLHEVIHAINYSMGIASGDEENLTNRLANGLCAVWKENPEVFKWWAATIKEPVKRKPKPNAKRKVSKRATRTRKSSRRR